MNAHAELGASVAARWMACPGSIRLAREVSSLAGGNGNIQNSYAQEGTRAHSVAEQTLSKGVDPDTFEGMVMDGGVVTEEMVEHVRVYVEHVREIIALCEDGEWWIERKFNLSTLHPPGPMFGTADFVGYERSICRLHVADLKFGMGVVVEVDGNKQLRYYALGALLSLNGMTHPVNDVEITIVQPRVGHPDGVARSEVLSVHEVVEFAAELMAAARRTQEPDAPLHAGVHCRFCPASGVCPEQREHALAIVQSEFGIVEEFKPPLPESIPANEFAGMLGKLHILDDWMKAMRATAIARLEQGIEVEGFKLVAKRAIRKWGDAEEAAQVLAADCLDDADIYDRSLKSPAQIEKLTGKKLFARLYADLVTKVSSGYNLAAVADSRPAVSVLTVGEEFALAAGDDE